MCIINCNYSMNISLKDKKLPVQNENKIGETHA